MAMKAEEKAHPSKKKTSAELLREQKIEACQSRIAAGEDQIKQIQAECGKLVAAEMIGLSVAHKLFGPGQIVENTRSIITVAFGTAEKRFVIPSAFLEGFLTSTEPQLTRMLARYREDEEQIQAIRNDIFAANREIDRLNRRSARLSAGGL